MSKRAKHRRHARARYRWLEAQAILFSRRFTRPLGRAGKSATRAISWVFGLVFPPVAYGRMLDEHKPREQRLLPACTPAAGFRPETKFEIDRTVTTEEKEPDGEAEQLQHGWVQEDS